MLSYHPGIFQRFLAANLGILETKFSGFLMLKLFYVSSFLAVCFLVIKESNRGGKKLG